MRKKFLVGLATGLFMIGTVGMAEASWISDPTPSISYFGDSVLLHMELSGYSNYGVADNKSDILYSGETGTWEFDLDSLGISASDFEAATVTTSLVLDDSYSRPTTAYSLAIDLNGTTMFSGPTDSLGLVHGSPFGQQFTNWTPLSFDTLSLSTPFTVSLNNATQIPSWIAIDYIELELTSAPAPVPEPATILLFGTGLAGFIGTRIRRKKK